MHRHHLNISENKTQQLRSAGCFTSSAVVRIVLGSVLPLLELRSEFRDSPYVIIYKAQSNVSIAKFDQISRASQYQ